MNWISIELSGYSYYSDKGYRILIPLVNNEGYDFVAEKNGEFVKVNVKTAHMKDKNQPESWCISQSGGSTRGHRKSIKCDIYLVWLPKANKFIELPGSFISTGNSKSKRLPKNLLHLT